MPEIEGNTESERVVEGPRNVHIRSSNDYSGKKDIFGWISGGVLIIIIIETVVGVFSNSISLLADSCRLFVDFLMYFELSRDAPKRQKYIELSFLLFGISISIILSILYMIISIKRLYSNDIMINSTIMLVGGFLAMVANIGMCIIHASDIFEPRRYTLLSDFISIRLQQSCHVIINHGLGFIVFFSTLLVFIDKNYVFTDSIAALIMAILILANTTAIINKCRRYLLKKYSYNAILPTENI
uniref:DUF1275 domain-containing protein n=1 Tax=Strongyloides venezuelensis TaxID=75913 RepID=A0A0K0FG32_STRVS